MDNLLRNPVKKPVRNGRKSKESTDEILRQIQENLKIHIGSDAMLFIKEGRSMIPYYVELTSLSKYWATAIHRKYSQDGTFRCSLSFEVSIVSLMVGDQKIVFFDEDI